MVLHTALRPDLVDERKQRFVLLDPQGVPGAMAVALIGVGTTRVTAALRLEVVDHNRKLPTVGLADLAGSGARPAGPPALE